MDTARYVYVARNNAAESANRIHSDEVARQYGFAGALVPGIATFAHALTPVLRTYGTDWLTHGAVTLRYRKPVYVGEEITVDLTRGDGADTLTVIAPDGEVRASGQVRTAAPDTDAAPSFPWTEPLDEPLPLDENTLLDHEWFGSVDVPATDEACAEWRDGIGLARNDDVAADSGLAHPGFLARAYADIMRANVARTGPSIHAGSDITFHRPVPFGTTLSLRGRIDRIFARKGQRFWVLDLAWYNGERLVMRAAHTAVYRLREPAEPISA